MMFRKSLAVGLVLLMVVSGFAGLIGGTGESNASDAGHLTPVVQAYKAHAPIRINNNSDFENQASNEGWNGSGTQADPYVIENYDIDGSGNGSCLYIGNTTAYFVVRNCSLHDASGNFADYFWNAGLALYNATNGRLNNNNASYNDGTGIFLDSSDSNTIINNRASNNDYGIVLLSSSSNTIANNTASSNNACGIFFHTSSSNTMANNTASNNNYGIYLYSSNNNNTIANNTASSNNDDGILLDYSSRNTVANNMVSTNWQGIDLYYSSSNTITNNTASSNNDDGILLEYSSRNTITNNTALSNKKDGIGLDHSSSNTITNNTATSNNDYGIYLDSSSNNNLTSNSFISNKIGIYTNSAINNTLYNNTIYNNTNHGIYFDSSSSNSIISNSITSNQWRGIVLIDSSSSNSIISNNISSNGYYGIYLNPGSNNITIRSNSILSNGDYGIYMESSYNGTISDNNISRNSEGIYLTSSSNNMITNNTASLNNYYGICLSSSDSNTITDNKASNNRGEGISLDSSNSNSIRGNNASNNRNGMRLGTSDKNNITNNIANSNTGNGIDLWHSDSNAITNNTISSNKYKGIYLNGCSSNIITDNNALSNGRDGIQLLSSSSNTIANNTASNNEGGIGLSSSSSNTIANNTASNNYNGIYLDSARTNTIMNNTMVNDGIFIKGSLLNHWNTHTIDISNTVNGKPVYYWKNQTGGTVPAGAGEVILANSTNVIVENQNVSKGSVGIELGFSTGCTIQNNTASSNNEDGIFLYSSSSNTLTNNTMVDDGIIIEGNSLEYWNTHSIDTSNTVNGKPVYYWKNQTDGTIPAGAGEVILANSTNVIVDKQSLISGTVGIELGFSTNCTIQNNTASSNNLLGISFYSSSNNTITNNTLSSNYYGMYLSSSSNNTIYHNNFIDNTVQAYDSTGNNIWNASYPTGGNYWSDYNGTDNYSGQAQNISGPDGIGDTPYTDISGGSGADDSYPLMEPTVDLTPPDITITSPSDGAILNTSNVTIYWNGSDSRSGIDHYEVRIDSGAWENVSTDTSYDFTALPDGSHRVYVKAVDNASNENTASVTFTVDTTPPEILNGTPKLNATGVPVDQVLIINFSEPINTTTFNYSCSPDPAGWSVSWSDNNTRVALTHNDFEYNTTYNFTVIEAKDLAGNPLKDAPLSVNFTTELKGDTIPPSSSITTISPYWQNSQLTLTLSATDDKDLSNITLYYRFSTDNSSWSNWTQFGSNISASGTSWSGTTDFTFPDGDGYYEFYTIARDIAGNNESKTQADAICGYDATAPEVTITSPFDGTIFNTSSVTVSWTGSDATSGIDHYEVRNDSGPWSDVGLNTSYNFTQLLAGSHRVDVKAVDSASSENTRSVTFRVDATPPTVVSASPTGTGVPVTQNVVVLFNESMNTGVTPTLTQTSGTSVTYTFAGWSTTTVANDTATWTHPAWKYNETIGLNVSGAEDLAGNTLDDYSWSFTTAAGATATATGPTNTAPSNVADITITYNYDGGVTSVDLYYTTDGGTTWNLIGSDPTIDGSYSWTIPVDGTYAWMAVGDGETAPTGGENPEAASYTYDGTAPAVSISSPTDGTIFNTSSLAVSWTGSDATSGINHYEVRIDGGSWTDVGTATTHDFTGLSDSSHTVDVKAIDNATNEATDTVTFTTDTTNPIVSITSPSNDTALNTSSVTVSWTGSDATSGIDHYEIRIGGSSWTTVGTNTSCTFTGLSDDSHTVDVKVIDKAGNENTTSTSFTIDITAPTITQHSPTGQNVSVDSTINLTFSEPMNRASVQITVSGLSGTISWNGSTAVFTPAANLSAGTTYFVNVTGTDTAGDHLMPYTWNFSTAEIINPPAESTTGNISGIVVDENGEPVAGATVAVQGTNITTITDSTGHFMLENVSAGPHNLTISREGFNDTTTKVSVTEGETATVNPTIHPIPSQPAKGSSMLWWIILVVLAVLIAVGLLMRKKGGKKPHSPEETANPGPEDADMEEPEEITKPAEPEAPSSSPSPPPENTQAQKPKFSREEMIANIEKAYREGRMSEEMYRRNMEKFGKL